QTRGSAPKISTARRYGLRHRGDPLKASAFQPLSARLGRPGVHPYYGHVFQVPVELVIIQAEADHETIRDFETAEIHRNLHDPARVAVQKRPDRPHDRTAA